MQYPDQLGNSLKAHSVVNRRMASEGRRNGGMREKEGGVDTKRFHCRQAGRGGGNED